MPDATITSTASTFGTISGVFSADQSTISGTISGIVPGTLTGSVGVPGPAGPAGAGVPAGGTAGQFLQKTTTGVDYATDWVTVNLTGLATESWVTAGFYPLTGNPSSFLTASALTPYLTSATAASTYQTLAGMSSYLTTSTAASTYQTLSGMSDYLAKAGNLAGLANTGTARTNLGLGSLAVVNDAPSDGSQYARKNAAWEVVTTTPDFISSVSSPLSVTTGNLTIDLSAYAPLASPAFTGNPTAPTAALGDNDTSLATTAFVQQELASGVAVAKNLEVYVRNQSGSTIPAGSIVYISGATGNKPLITLAQANNDANSAQTMGFTKTAIANNGFGYVIVRGELENIDTSALTEGAQLYLSPTVAGTWTTTKPSAPQHLVYVGIVVRAHPTQGIILVAVQNGYELNELHDVAISSPTNGQVLKYNSSTNLWVNGTDSAGVAWGGITGTLSSQTDLQNALDLKLAAATAASTYATILEPSVDGILTVEPSGSNTASVNVNQDANNYIHLRAGVGQIAMIYGGATKWFFNDTYLQFPGGTQQTVAYPGSSGFLLKADNLSGLANTGTARTNLGLGTMAVETASNYLTTASASSTYFTIANAANKADLASPTFTGTPSLPTGTIGVTQTAGNNTTAIATTAFVQQEVPSASTTAAGKVELATLAEIITGTDTGRVMPVSQIPVTTASPYLRSLAIANFTSVSGGAAVTANSGQQFSREAYLTGTASGRAAFALGFVGTATANPSFHTANFGQINFSDKIVLSGTTVFGITGYAGNANTCIYVTLGGYSSQTTGAMTQKGIGIKKVGGTSNVIELIVHNGTSQTAVSSSTAPALLEAVNWTIYSDGTGNVTLYINGSQAATTSAGPTGTNTAGNSAYREQVECPSGSGATHSIHSVGGWVYIRP